MANKSSSAATPIDCASVCPLVSFIRFLLANADRNFVFPIDDHIKRPLTLTSNEAFFGILVALIGTLGLAIAQEFYVNARPVATLELPISA